MNVKISSSLESLVDCVNEGVLKPGQLLGISKQLVGQWPTIHLQT